MKRKQGASPEFDDDQLLDLGEDRALRLARSHRPISCLGALAPLCAIQHHRDGARPRPASDLSLAYYRPLPERLSRAPRSLPWKIADLEITYFYEELARKCQARERCAAARHFP